MNPADRSGRSAGLRGVVVLVYALLIALMIVESTLPPLLPTFSREFGLSTVETGALLAASAFGMLLASIPAGLVADRFGARAITLAGGAVVTLAALVQGFAMDFWSLLAGRGLFGLGLGTIWTAGVAWISHRPTGRAAALGGTTSAAALGFMVGPALGGNLAERFGVSVPFVVAAGVAAAVTVALAFVRENGGRTTEERQPLPSTLRAVSREQRVVSALVLVLLGGLAMGTVNLLVPLHLDANGLSAGGIGTALSAMSAVFFVSSALVARLGDRPVTLATAAAGLLVGATVFVLPIASGATAVLVLFLLLRGSLAAPLSTIAYPLAVAGGESAGVRAGAALALVNVAWSSTATVGPLVAGGIAEVAGERGAFGVLLAAYAVAGAAMLAVYRRGAPVARIAVADRTS